MSSCRFATAVPFQGTKIASHILSVHSRRPNLRAAKAVSDFSDDRVVMSRPFQSSVRFMLSSHWPMNTSIAESLLDTPRLSLRRSI